MEQEMNVNSDGLRIEVLDSEESFLAIKNEWDALIDKSINSSIYATYPFVYTAWKHFKGKNDQLFILLVKRNGTLVGILPFRIERINVNNIYPLRTIRFISEWGGGDKPSIVTTEKQNIIWDRIFQFLKKEFTQWDGLLLIEQPAKSPVLYQGFFSNIWYSAKVVPEFSSYYISLTGTWEEYINTRGKNTRRRWKKDTKKLYDISEGVTFKSIEDPKTLPDALKRFIDIEQSGWKKNCDFSVGGSEKQKAFYEDLLGQLAQKNMVAIYFLTSGTTDIAGDISFKCNSTVYSAQVTYNQKYADSSPGVILTAEITKTLFGTHYQELDFLGVRNDHKNDSKKNWSTGSRQTITVQVYKRSFRVYFYMIVNKVNQSLQNLVRLIPECNIPEQSQDGTAYYPDFNREAS